MATPPPVNPDFMRLMGQITGLLGQQPGSPVSAAPTTPQTPVGSAFNSNGTVSQQFLNLMGAIGNKLAEPAPVVAAPKLNTAGLPDLTAALGGSGVDPSIAKLYAQNNAMMGKIQALGATPSHAHQSLLHRIVDVVSRPAYAVGDAAYQFEKAGINHDSIGSTIGHTAGGIVHGLSGTQKELPSAYNQLGRDQTAAIQKAVADKTTSDPTIKNNVQGWLKENNLKPTYNNVLQAWQHLGIPLPKIDMSNITPGAGGSGGILGRIQDFGLNILADPTTYVGAGPVKSIVKGAVDAAKGGKLAEEITPTITELVNHGMQTASTAGLTNSERINQIVKQLTFPAVEGAIPVGKDVAAQGTRNLKEVLDAAHATTYNHVFNNLAAESAAAGRPILKLSELPDIQKVVDLSKPEAVSAGFKRYAADVKNQEIRSGIAHPIEYPSEAKTAAAFDKALQLATDAGDTAKVAKMLINPATGKNVLQEGAKTTEEAYNKLFSVLNHGAKNETQAALNVVKRQAVLDALKPAQVAAAHAEHISQPTALHQVAASLSSVAKMKDYIGRDLTKLESIIPTGTKNGAFSSHLGTLPTYLDKVTTDAGHALTAEEKAVAVDHWWAQAYVTAARVMHEASNPALITNRSTFVSNAAKDAKAGRYSGLRGKDQTNAIGAVKTFARHEHNAIMSARQHLADTTKAEVAGRSAEDLMSEARNKAATEKLLSHEDFHPTKSDSTAFDTARIANEALKAEIGSKAAAESDVAFMNIRDSLIAASHQAFAPEMITQLGLKLGSGKNAIVLMKSPEFVSKWLHEYFTSNSYITNSFRSFKNAFQHAFVSTGKMDPEIASLKNAAAGRAFQFARNNNERLKREFEGVSVHEGQSAFHDWITGGTVSSELAAHFDGHVNELAAVLRDPEMRRIGVNLAKVNGYMPQHLKMLLSKNKKELQDALGYSVEHTAIVIKKAMRGVIDDPKVTHDPVAYLGALDTAKARVVNNAMLNHTVAETWGISTKDAATGKISSAIQDLVDHRGYTTLEDLAKRSKVNIGVIPGNLKGATYVFEPQVAKDLLRTFELLYDNKSIEDFSKFMQKSVQPWKAMTTIYNLPSYQLRNSFQNGYMMWLAMSSYGGSALSMARAYQIAAKMLGKRSEELKASFDPLAHALTNPNDTSRALFSNANQLGHKFSDVAGNYITKDKMDAILLHYGLDTGFTATQFGNRAKMMSKLAQVGPGKFNIHNLNKALVTATQASENYFRYALLIDAIRNSTKPTLEEAGRDAAQTVRKYLFDYHDLTGAEKTAFTNVIPFYKWTRKAIPVMAETMFTQPGKIINPLILQRSLSQAAGGQFNPNDPWQSMNDKVVPDWIKGTMQFPFGQHGKNTIYGSAAIPFNDVVNGLDPSAIAGMINPLYRVPVETKVTGKQFYHNLPIKNKLQYATIGQFPQFSKITSALNPTSGVGPGQSQPSTGGNVLLQFLKNLGLTQTTENKVSSQKSQLTADLQKHQIQHKALVKKNVKNNLAGLIAALKKNNGG